MALAGALVCVLAVAACSSPKPTPPPPPKEMAMWGDMKPIVSVKELMRDFIDPASDYVFDSIGTVVTKKGGVVEKFPKTDEDWDHLRIGATMLAEGAYLLKVPRPFAPPGDMNNSTGPDPEEISPAQIEAKIEKDPVLWNAKIEALRNVGLEVLERSSSARTRTSCGTPTTISTRRAENCHLDYWYPGEGEFLKKLDKKLDDLYGGVRADRSRKLGMDPK